MRNFMLCALAAAAFALGSGTTAAAADAPAAGDASAAAKALVADLAASRDDAAVHAAGRIAQLGAPAAPVLIEALANDNARVRRFAAFALAKMGPGARAAVAPLMNALKDKDELVRRNAAEALGRMGDAGAVRGLMTLLGNGSVRVQNAAVEAVKALAGDDANIAAAIAAFEKKRAAANTAKADPDDINKFPADQYLIGGPMAGIDLPLFPTQHGEPAGHPGCIPALAEKAARENPKLMDDGDPLNDPFTPVGQNPEMDLYPGSVEHWRAYMLKYLPLRSFFDRQSLLKNWTAPDIPGATRAQAEAYAAPINWVPRWGHHVPTDYKMAPAPVVRWGAASAPFVLDCGELAAGPYAVRIVAAVPRDQINYFRKSLFIRMKVNDGLDGSVTTYLRRVGYTDEFYSMCELFFQAPASRAYRVELSVAEGSEVELLVHNVTLDDPLAGVPRRPLKTRMTMHTDKDLPIGRTPRRARFADLLQEERDLRDAWMWQSFPPPNTQANRPYRLPEQVKEGAADKTPAQIQAENGAWNQVLFGRFFNATPTDTSVWLTNAKLKLNYSLDDRDHNRPLPDPYPYKDQGPGLTYPDPKDTTAGAYWTPIGNVVRDFYWSYPSALHNSVTQWQQTGDDSFARDAALALARWAYAFPTLYTQTAYMHNMIAEYGDVDRAGRFQRRMTTSGFYRWYTEYANEIVDDYDLLYDRIANDWELAASVGRFVPWVKTPRDVTKLIDVYLVEVTAKRVLRYHWHTGEMNIARLASLVGDNTVTDPWMEWLFTKTFVYPFPVAGLPDLMVTGCTREGTEYVASTSYAGGENAIPKAAALESYLKAGGNPSFNLSDPVRYPKPVISCYWLMQRCLGGLNDIRIGDVCGPDKFYGRMFSELDTASYQGWKWAQDPIFAFMRVHYFGRKDFSDAEWAKIQAAAKQVTRAPWLDMPSRVLPQWAAILESGRRHDDYRFRRALFLRNGMGWGHHHDDGLDLQIYAHGAMMTCDGGQRPSYSKPGDRSTRMHNLAEVDGLGARGGEWLGHNWTRTLSDADGAKYLLCEATPPPNHQNVKLYERQTALLDVDEGQGSQPLTPEQCKPNVKLPGDIKSANSYVFDVVRISGGKRHTYCFHGNLSTAVANNLNNVVAIDKAPQKDQDYVSRMAGERLAGDAPDHLILTWQLSQGQVGRDLQPNAVEPGGYFTRLHVLGEKGARVLRGSLDCVKWGYQIPMAFVQRRSADEDDANAPGKLESAFAAIIEPHVGEPFLADMALIPVANNETDAQRAVAVEVTTTNGHTDVCFADGRPDKSRSFRTPHSAFRISGEFAYLSMAGGALRQATLTGGTLLDSPDVMLKPAAREYVGKVTKVDYATKTMWIDQAWPAIDGARRAFTLETGVPGHWTSYTAAAVKPAAGGSAITMFRGADYYLSRVKEIDAKTNTVYCSLGFGSGDNGGNPTPGMDREWVASNDDAGKTWRAQYLGGNIGLARYGFKLTGAPATMADFGRERAFRLWEYGVGDSVRHSTAVSLRAAGDGVYELQADVAVTVALKGASLEYSADGKTWRALTAKPAGGRVEATVAVADLSADGKGWLRVK